MARHDAGPGPRLGVEEEFLVVDAATRTVVPRAAAVVARAADRLGPRVSGEITELQVETRTSPVCSVKELVDQLVEARRVVARAAAADGLRVIASGTSVLPGAADPPVTRGPRQDRGTATFRGLHDELAICALHVHVEMPDRERALLVGNHLRAYLPLLVAMTANSPYWEGRDSGYASWRTMIWPRWPVAGPPPRFDSQEHYERVVAMLHEAGAVVDAGTLFWDIRPSVTHPTVEVRVADVPVTAPESALVAALVRAWAAHADEAVVGGDTGPDIPAELLRAAYWRAARDGLDGEVLDVTTGRLRPAREALADAVAEAMPRLRSYGDAELVDGWLRSLLAAGSGATRQRAAVARRGVLTDAVDFLAASVSDAEATQESFFA
ncbi:glutamate--cysteine ligase [Micromonospora sp. R77]|uniref:carboxylate-amine ligase n=1 Tax=Micromonospora sp. R77 TaxID=2925836 RepID=UPI001F60184B|nr:glutamate--cysteine ligase [Micromonospora sp. R77]MCI4066633.1 glutamate--cysteine ligase [Micromonospora sp. R77]